MARLAILMCALFGVVVTQWTQGRACYGAGGGHGSWTCGSSEAGCTADGGVASYDAGYVSSYMGCCMCEDGCDHTAETGESCSYPPSSPMPLAENPAGIAGIAVGAVVVLGAVGFLVYKKMKAAKAASGDGAKA
jgi:hypothetical protein